MTIDGNYGVPTVSLHTKPFAPAVRSVVRVNGMPRVGGETNGYWRIVGSTYQKTVSVDAWR